MPSVITKTDIELPEHLKTIEESSFCRYLEWQDDKKQLSKRLKTKFKQGINSRIGYSDNNRPDKEVKEPLTIGELEFLITTKPTTKRPSYSSTNVEFGNFLNQLLEHYKRGLLKKDYRTIEGGPYITVDLFIDKLKNDLKTLLEGREGIEQKIDLIKPEPLITEVPHNFPLVFDRDYSPSTEYNARMFVLAGNMISEGNRRTDGYKEKQEGKEIEVKRFKRLLLDDSLQTIGEYPKSPTPVAYPFETYSFVHQLEPRKSYQHASIINAFINRIPKKLTKGSKIGDFIKIQAIFQDESLKTKLTELSLIDEEFMSDYNPTLRDGKVYVRLQGVIDRLNNYREKFSTTSIEQNIIIKFPKYRP